MNYKIILSLTVVLLVAAILAGIGQTRFAKSKQSGKSVSAISNEEKKAADTVTVFRAVSGIEFSA